MLWLEVMVMQLQCHQFVGKTQVVKEDQCKTAQDDNIHIHN